MQPEVHTTGKLPELPLTVAWLSDQCCNCNAVRSAGVLQNQVMETLVFDHLLSDDSTLDLVCVACPMEAYPKQPDLQFLPHSVMGCPEIHVLQRPEPHRLLSNLDRQVKSQLLRL